jgi:hypothetical protein
LVFHKNQGGPKKDTIDRDGFEIRRIGTPNHIRISIELKRRRSMIEEVEAAEVEESMMVEEREVEEAMVVEREVEEGVVVEEREVEVMVMKEE